MAGKKRKRPAEDLVSESPRSIDPSDFMVASRVAAMAEEGLQCKQREIVTLSKQPGQEGG